MIVGAYFPEFGSHHIIEPFEIPQQWLRFRAMDWGSARPFSVGWYAVSEGGKYPKGALIKYREWYGMTPDEPNVGLKMTAEEVAQGIRARTPHDEHIAYSVLDPAAFAMDGGPSIAERMAKEHVVFRPADNKRIARNGALGGWDQLRARLKGEEDKPMIYFFTTCKDTIRTLPTLQHDEDRPEDVNSESEDHAPDETRYAVMSRPYTPVREVKVLPKDITQKTFNELWKETRNTKDERI